MSKTGMCLEVRDKYGEGPLQLMKICKSKKKCGWWAWWGEKAEKAALGTCLKTT